MVRQAKFHDLKFRAPFHALLRANRSVALALLWAALAACVAGSLAFDIADWLSAWRDVGVGLLSGVAII